MGRYYFNVRCDGTVFVDHTGVRLPSLQDAWIWALRDAMQLIREGSIDRTRHRYWIEVCDEHQCAVLSIPVGPMTVQ
jgi:hypothetical protein